MQLWLFYIQIGLIASLIHNVKIRRFQPNLGANFGVALNPDITIFHLFPLSFYITG